VQIIDYNIFKKINMFNDDSLIKKNGCFLLKLVEKYNM